MPVSLEGHEKRLSRLEKKDEHYEERFSRLHKKIDENEQKSEEETKRIFQSLDDIKSGQHSQELTNQKMNFTLDTINRERELDRENREKKEEEKKQHEKESRNDIKQIKLLILGAILTLGTTFIGSLVRMWLGI